MPQTGILITIFQTISTMAIKTRAQLIAANDALFTANGAKEITGPLVNEFNDDFIDSVALPAELFKDITKAALATAITNSQIIIGTRYRITDATAGVVVVWGIDADVISTFGYVEGNYDGSTWTKSKPGNYQLVADFFMPTDNTYSVAPGTGNDENQGFAIGDVWIDSTTKIQYNAVSVGSGAADWQAQSGEYTPTITDNGADVSATLLKAYFQRVGNLVYCDVQIDLSISYSTGTGNIYITTPISSSATLDLDNTFGNYDFKGLQAQNVFTDLLACNIGGDGSNSVKLELTFGANITSPGRTYLSFVYPLS